MSKLCILIGGSKGLGLALYNHYQQNGFTVEEFSRSGSGPHHHSVDLSRRESIDVIDARMQQLAAQGFQEIHLLINAGSLGPIGPLHMSEPKDWWHSIDINFTLPITILGRFQTVFRAVDARKVAAFVSSGAASHPFHGWSLYCANKAGVEQFVRTMAVEQSVEALPILCANLDPGVMDTGMQSEIRSATPEQFSLVEQFVQRHDAGGLAAPEAVAENTFNALIADFENGASLRVAGY
ncbi:SDR family NAD(P)-dependent oxidoreductase [Reinekea marinisedimentorum]|uniref:Benzil reductase ((S)-benzoin forming) n=1 Tax=Reinekea marinisedimentorum TaxID=230495 RepID=A0A4R3I2Y2_9GAMM|nr:SDR family NAD(P)-dependent oxidoreductase [Reinekea marinisedimentorum]TCS40139.1 benzil reductase ((S)-benzoin forming) [Reinekea marinisedimentorum]